MQTKIREFRTALGLTQEELAARVQVRRETIVFLEKGKYNPSLRLAHAVAKALGTTVDALFSFGDEEAGGGG
jgi:putative transcriptional regulator